ncbi:hypothetical protein HZB07_07320 [Candidatus Saganbacteria bacterium]|nr:hypothetical protein [Candidatus Saganbacteria bacterium]
MRTIIYAPIIHTSADLGSLSKEVKKRGLASLGEEVWEKHQKTIAGFWDSLMDYFGSIDVKEMNIYQDGMVGEDEIGKAIIEAGAMNGSKNHELVLSLIKRGAILVKTEDFKLVKEERDRLVALTEAKTLMLKLIAFLKYKMVKNRLLNQRDKFIAGRIDKTLGQGETGILFMGAYHNVKSRLPKDIQVAEIKDTGKVREYQELLPFYGKKKEQFEELGRYLISKVVV